MCWLSGSIVSTVESQGILLLLQGVFKSCSLEKRTWQGSVGSLRAAVVKAKCYATKILMYSITVRVCSWINWLIMSIMVDLSFLPFLFLLPLQDADFCELMENSLCQQRAPLLWGGATLPLTRVPWGMCFTVELNITTISAILNKTGPIDMLM